MIMRMNLNCVLVFLIVLHLTAQMDLKNQESKKCNSINVRIMCSFYLINNSDSYFDLYLRV